MIRPAGCLAFALAMSMSAAAMANTIQGNVMVHNWVASDRCTQRALRAFPDYTAESIAKRDAMLKQCLAGSNLPPRATEAPQPGNP